MSSDDGAWAALLCSHRSARVLPGGEATDAPGGRRPARARTSKLREDRLARIARLKGARSGAKDDDDDVRAVAYPPPPGGVG
jgi:hypothetical protein